MMNLKTDMDFSELSKQILSWLIFATIVGAIAYCFIFLKRKLQSGVNHARDKLIEGSSYEEAEENASKASQETGYSFPFGIPLIIYPLLFYGAYKGSHNWWGYGFHVIFLGMVAIFTVSGTSRKSFNDIHEKYPDMNRTTWVMNNLLFFAILPLIVWVILFLPLIFKR